MKNYLTGNQAGLIRDWTQALDGKILKAEDSEKTHNPFSFDRGPRARLRRCNRLDDVAQESAVWVLVERLSLAESQYQALMLVAAVLAHVKENVTDGKSLACLLGVASVATGEKARLSELRFQRLMRSDEPDDFLQQLRRAIGIWGGPVDVAMLANDLFAWSAERRFANRRSDGVKYRWARDYYLKRADQAQISDTPPAPSKT